MVDAALSAQFLPGAILAGKYRVERLLGAGGMGVVCLATHVELEQQVALKFLLPGAVQNIDRFMREARAAARLKSEHVVRVLDVAKAEDGRPYMVLEYLEGRDLDQVLAAEGPLPVRTAADYLVQACEGLAEAHARGIVHRDLKPGNLFLTKGSGGEPLIKILDFGIAKMTNGVDPGLTQTSSVMGSPVYMSPEQMRSGRDAVIASDVWALGVMLQELLTQQLPFDGESMPELCLKVVAGEPRSPLLDRPDLPRVVVDIIERCLQKEPSARFNDAGKVAAALRPLVSPSMLTVADRAAQLTEATHVDGAAMRASVPPRSSEQSSVVPSSAYLPLPQVVLLPDASRRPLEATPATVSTGGGTTLPPPPPSLQNKGSSWRPIGAVLALAFVAAALLLAFRTGASSAVTALPTAPASITQTAPTAIPPASAAAASSAVATPETTAAPPATAAAKSAEPEPAATPAGATRPKPVKTAATGASAPPPAKTGATPGDEIPAFR